LGGWLAWVVAFGSVRIRRSAVQEEVSVFLRILRILAAILFGFSQLCPLVARLGEFRGTLIESLEYWRIFMIGYVTLGTNDLERAAAFYDQLLAEIGAKRFMEEESFIAWAVAPNQPAMSVTRPFDGKEATVGNGIMVALVVDSQDKVKAMHKKALELGGTDEGAPGPRGDSGFYAGYFRDLDGNKLNIFCFG